MPTAGRLRFAGPAAFAVAFTTQVAHAQSGPRGELRYDLPVDVPVTAGAVGLSVTLELLKGQLAPRSCRVCGVDGLDAAVRDALRWNDTETANTVSNWTGFVATPVTALGMSVVASAADHRLDDAPSNALVAVEATALAVTLDGVVKLLVGRQRPYARYRDPSEPATPNDDENLSFYSGHTNLAFAIAVASGTVASMRRYRLAPAVWGISLPVAAVTGYLRIAADKHYFTDVIAGAVVGSAAGFLVPFVFHRAPTTNADAAPVPGPEGHGPFIASSWTF